MANYVAVPAEAIEAELQARGFTRSVQYQEVVYTRCHEKDHRVVVKVFTSIKVGSTSARARGKDSIKACTVYNGSRSSYGIGRFPPVFRVGSVDAVLERMMERAREAYARGTEWIKERDAKETARESLPRSPAPQSGYRSMRRHGVVQGGIDP